MAILVTSRIGCSNFYRWRKDYIPCVKKSEGFEKYGKEGLINTDNLVLPNITCTRRIAGKKKTHH